MKSYKGPIWRVEGKPQLKAAGPIQDILHPWIPVEEYADEHLANLRLKYWQTVFPFHSLFTWRVNKMSHPPPEVKNSLDQTDVSMR